MYMASSKKRKHDGGGVSEEVHRFVPTWVADLARAKGCSSGGVFFIADKRVQKSDLARHQNRLLLPKDYVSAHLLPVLSAAERAAANLVDEPGSSGEKTYAKKKKQPAAAGNEPAEPKRQKAAGREHVGLPVTAFARNGFRFRLRLTQWDSNRETVMKGDEMRLLKTFSSFAAGEEIEVWGFRLVDGGDLCFAIGRRA